MFTLLLNNRLFREADMKDNQNRQKNEPDSKTRILETATRLFAHKGFDGVGMRQLAREAKVNLAMINYFFGSKNKLLEEILSEFYQGLMQIMRESVAGDDPPPVKLKRYLVAAAGYVAANQDQVVIAISHLPLDSPEIRDYKADYVQTLIKIMKEGLMDDLAEELQTDIPLLIIGPMIIGSIVSNILLKPILSKFGDFSFDQSFYESYPEIISDLVMHGVMGLVNKQVSPEPEAPKL